MCTSCHGLRQVPWCAYALSLGLSPLQLEIVFMSAVHYKTLQTCATCLRALARAPCTRALACAPCAHTLCGVLHDCGQHAMHQQACCAVIALGNAWLWGLWVCRVQGAKLSGVTFDRREKSCAVPWRLVLGACCCMAGWLACLVCALALLSCARARAGVWMHLARSARARDTTMMLVVWCSSRRTSYMAQPKGRLLQ